MLFTHAYNEPLAEDLHRRIKMISREFDARNRRAVFHQFDHQLTTNAV